MSLADLNRFATATAEAWPSPPDADEADRIAVSMGGGRHREWRDQVVVAAVLRALKERGSVTSFTSTLGELIGELPPQRQLRIIMAGYEAGVADLIVSLPGGRCIHGEIKSRGGRLSAAQKRERERLQAAGHTYITAQGAGAFLVALAGEW